MRRPRAGRCRPAPHAEAACAGPFYLAAVENGEAVLTRDGPRRAWTERAAASGDRKAMHNLALFYFSGDGGQKNMTTAAQWFRRAADQGLVDSQYNLGRLYEEGFGVTTNPAEAYKWYLIAGRAGDGEARTSAERIKRQLTPAAQAAAEGRARLPQPGARRRAPAAGRGGPEIAQRKARCRASVLRGPTDGVASHRCTGDAASSGPGMVATARSPRHLAA